jgi:hypothetical protein
MADDFGRVNPVSPHFLDRGAREEPYQGCHSRKHHEHGMDHAAADTDVVAEEEAGVPASTNHIDLRI